MTLVYAQDRQKYWATYTLQPQELLGRGALCHEAPSERYADVDANEAQH